MKTTEAIRAIMADQGIGPVKLATRMGLEKEKTRLITDRLAQKNISIEKLNEMLRLMDYKIVLVPTDEVKSNKGWYVIE